MKNNLKTIFISIITSVFTFLALSLITGNASFLRNINFNDAGSSATAEGGKVAAIESGKDLRIDAESAESQVIDVVDKANPAVVSIVVTKNVPKIERYYQEYDPFGDGFLNDFFGDRFGLRVPRQRQNGTEKREVGGGSGFFVSTDGFLVTNRHVVEDEKAEYTVLTNDGKKYKAEIMAKDVTLDVAVLKVKGGKFSYLKFGNSDRLKSGQTVIAIGNALAEFRNSVSVGVVSGLFRSIVAGDVSGNSEQLEGVIQTDTAINPGNSGGPLLDLKGNVIGVNVAVERGAQNIGFALPSNTVRGIYDSVKKHGEIVRPYLGVRYIQITESLKEQNNLSVDYGALIAKGDNPQDLAIAPGSPADKAAIQENDIILEIDGVKVEQGKSLASIIRQKQVGETINLTILRGNNEKQIEVKLAQAPDSL